MSHIPGNTADTELVETGDVKCPAVYKISPGDRNQPGPKRQLLLRNTDWHGRVTITVNNVKLRMTTSNASGQELKEVCPFGRRSSSSLSKALKQGGLCV